MAIIELQVLCINSSKIKVFRMIGSVLNINFAPIKNIKSASKTHRVASLGLTEDKFEYRNKNVDKIGNKKLNFSGNKFSIPVELIKKEGEEALKLMPSFKTIEAKSEHFENYLDSIVKLNTIEGEVPKGLTEDFHGDYTHELFGSFCSAQSLAVMEAEDPKVIDKALKSVVKHVNKTSDMYQFFLDNEMHSKDTTIGANKVFKMVMDAFKDKADAKKISIAVENEHLLDEHSHATVEDYKNYIIKSNLVANAIKYSPAESHVKIGFQVKEDKLHFSVADKGIGIDPAEHTGVVRGSRASNVGDIPGSGYGLRRVNNILQEAKANELKITSPLYPDSENKGTHMECSLISDCTKNKLQNSPK